MNKDVKTFGEREIKIINSMEGMPYQLKLLDTNKEIEGKHVVNIIWQDKDNNTILKEELFEPMVNPYLYGVKSTLEIINKEV